MEIYLLAIALVVFVYILNQKKRREEHLGRTTSLAYYFCKNGRDVVVVYAVVSCLYAILQTVLLITITDQKDAEALHGMMLEIVRIHDFMNLAKLSSLSSFLVLCGIFFASSYLLSGKRSTDPGKALGLKKLLISLSKWFSAYKKVTKYVFLILTALTSFSFFGSFEGPASTEIRAKLKKIEKDAAQNRKEAIGCLGDLTKLEAFKKIEPEVRKYLESRQELYDRTMETRAEYERQKQRSGSRSNLLEEKLSLRESPEKRITEAMRKFEFARRTFGSTADAKADGSRRTEPKSRQSAGDPSAEQARAPSEDIRQVSVATNERVQQQLAELSRKTRGRLLPSFLETLITKVPMDRVTELAEEFPVLEVVVKVVNATVTDKVSAEIEERAGTIVKELQSNPGMNVEERFTQAARSIAGKRSIEKPKEMRDQLNRILSRESQQLEITKREVGIFKRKTDAEAKREEGRLIKNLELEWKKVERNRKPSSKFSLGGESPSERLERELRYLYERDKIEIKEPPPNRGSTFRSILRNRSRKPSGDRTETKNETVKPARTPKKTPSIGTDHAEPIAAFLSSIESESDVFKRNSKLRKALAKISDANVSYEVKYAYLKGLPPPQGKINIYPTWKTKYNPMTGRFEKAPDHKWPGERPLSRRRVIPKPRRIRK